MEGAWRHLTEPLNPHHFFKQVLDSPVLPNASKSQQFFVYRNQLRRLSLKVAIKHDIFPTLLVLKGVLCTDNTNQYGSGGFSDVFCGTYNGEKVALKRLRTYAMMTDEQNEILKKVRRIQLMD